MSKLNPKGKTTSDTTTPAYVVVRVKNGLERLDPMFVATHVRQLPLGITHADLRRLSRKEKHQLAAALIGRKPDTKDTLVLETAEAEDNSLNSTVMELFAKALPLPRTDHLNPQLQVIRRRNIELVAQHGMQNFSLMDKTKLKDPTHVIEETELDMASAATGRGAGWFDVARSEI